MLKRRRSTGGQLVAHGAGARQVGNIGRLNLKGGDAAILLFNAYIQGAGYGIIEILDTERTCRHQRFIEHTALLADNDLGIGPGNADDFRCIAAQIGRQLVVIGVQCKAGKTEAIKHV